MNQRSGGCIGIRWTESLESVSQGHREKILTYMFRRQESISPSSLLSNSISPLQNSSRRCTERQSKNIEFRRIERVGVGKHALRFCLFFWRSIRKQDFTKSLSVIHQECLHCIETFWSAVECFGRGHGHAEECTTSGSA